MESFLEDQESVFATKFAPHGETCACGGRCGAIPQLRDPGAGRASYSEAAGLAEYPTATTEYGTWPMQSGEDGYGARPDISIAEAGGGESAAAEGTWSEWDLHYGEQDSPDEHLPQGETDPYFTGREDTYRLLDSTSPHENTWDAMESDQQYGEFGHSGAGGEVPTLCCRPRGDEPKFPVYPGATPDGVAEPYTTDDPKEYGVALWDYKVNDYALRPAHESALRSLVAKIAADDRAGVFSEYGGWHIDIEGFASRTGSDAHNKNLSWWRANVAARCILCMAEQAGLSAHGRLSVGSVEGKGYEGATSNEEDPRRRRLQIRVRPPRKAEPIPPRHAKDNFRLCLMSHKEEVSKVLRIYGILGYARVEARYRIQDRRTHEHQDYEYIGRGVAIDVPVDKVIPKKVMDKIPKPLWKLLTKALGGVVIPGKGGPKCSEEARWADFDVTVVPPVDPKHDPPRAIVGVKSFGGKVAMAWPAPGLGAVQIDFKNPIFLYNAKAKYEPNPLQLQVDRTLTVRAVILTEGTARMISRREHEATSAESSTVWYEPQMSLPQPR